jgi:NADH:ubiquinone oxidoreductase subunit 6 (subunit J)
MSESTQGCGAPMPGSTFERRWVAVVFGVAVGLFNAWAALQSFVGHAGWTVGAVLTLLIIAGCVATSTAVALSSLPDAMVRRTAYMWGDSIFTRGLIAFAFASIPALIWGIVLIELFGTPATR